MNFDAKIEHLNAQGHKFHVFQSYGDLHNETRGHSMSFGDFEAAKRHARNDITYEGWPEDWD